MIRLLFEVYIVHVVTNAIFEVYKNLYFSSIKWFPFAPKLVLSIAWVQFPAIISGSCVPVARKNCLAEAPRQFITFTISGKKKKKRKKKGEGGEAREEEWELKSPDCYTSCIGDGSSSPMGGGG